MADISAALVKELREMTGAGLMDCKRALTETAGQAKTDKEWLGLAADWLRTKGILKAAKKADRVAAEGLVGVAALGKEAAVVEVNSETDFVARNEQFQVAVRTIAGIALKNGGDPAKTLHAAAPSGGTVGEMLVNLVATIGENMTLRRAVSLKVSDGVVATYVHNKAPGADDLGKLGVLVALESTADKSRLMDLGRKIAMHVASADPAPQSTTREELDPKVVDKEREIQKQIARESGKAEGVIDKMVEGRLRKFYEESVLLEQKFMLDMDTTVGKFVEHAAKELGAPVKVTAFAKFKVGEGIEKPPEDFAGEVASMGKK
jgi:elongation factor Ts